MGANVVSKPAPILTLVVDNSTAETVKVTKGTEDVLIRQIVGILRGLMEDNRVFYQDEMSSDISAKEWSTIVSEFRADLCNTLVEYADDCEMMAEDIEVSPGGKELEKIANGALRMMVVGMVEAVSQLGGLQGVLGAKPKG